MDPFTINRLGQLRQQEYLDWAAQQPNHETTSPLRDMLMLVWQRFGLRITRTESRKAQPGHKHAETNIRRKAAVKYSTLELKTCERQRDAVN